MHYTTIQIQEKTRSKLSALKVNPRETYDQLLNELLNFVPTGDDEGKYTDEFRASLVKAHADIRAGRVIPFEKIKKQMGL